MDIRAGRNQFERSLVLGFAVIGALAILALAGIGVVSLFDGDGSSNRERVVDQIQATAPDVAGAGQIRTSWARQHIHAAEQIRGESCAVTTRIQPFHYLCTVTYRDANGRYRGYELRLVQSVPGRFFTVVSARPRQAGPPGAPQEPRNSSAGG